MEEQKPRARMSSSALSIGARYLRWVSGSFTFIWFSTASRSAGVHAARKARPMTDCEIGIEVPMSGSVVMPLPLRPLLCVSAGILAWVLLADRAGFFAAGLAQVLLSSLALPGQKWMVIGAIAVVLNIAAYVLFVHFLGLPLPAFGN